MKKNNYESLVKEAQAYLDQRMDQFYSNPSNSDGGSWDEKYKILLSVARKYEVDESDLNIT